jgi:hypothetical protein
VEFAASAGGSAGQQKTLTYMTALPINQLSDYLHVAVCLSALRESKSFIVCESQQVPPQHDAGQAPAYNLMVHSHLMLSQC